VIIFSRKEEVKYYVMKQIGRSRNTKPIMVVMHITFVGKSLFERFFFFIRVPMRGVFYFDKVEATMWWSIYLKGGRNGQSFKS
jgi:hypothetical protein